MHYLTSLTLVRFGYRCIGIFHTPGTSNLKRNFPETMTGQFEPAVASLRTLYDCRMIVLIILVAIILVVIMHGNPMIMFLMILTCIFSTLLSVIMLDKGEISCHEIPSNEAD